MTGIRVLEKRAYVRDRQGQFAATAASRVAAGHETTVQPGELRDVLDHMAARKDDPNLTLLDVAGTNLFNVGGDHARHDMPQVPSDRKVEFVRDMKADGRTVLRTDLDPLTLKPSQGEISGRAVGQIANRERNGNGRLTDDAARIIVSSDGYVLDGHHRWGAYAALNIEGDRRTIPAFQMAAKRDDALGLLRAWGEKAGVQSLALGERARKALAEQDLFEDMVKSRTYVRDARGRFAEVGGHGDTLTGEPLPEGWTRLTDEQALDLRVAALRQSALAEPAARRVAERLPPETVYTDGKISIHTPVGPDGLDPQHHGVAVRQAHYLQRVAPVDDMDIRISDRFVTEASGQRLDRDTVGWTSMLQPTKDGHATIAIRPVAFTDRTPLRQGLTVGSGGEYVMAHEWGHAVKQPKADRSREAALYRMYGDAAQVSGYAMSKPAEFYAEAFADWHQSRGQTKRPVVRKAAKEFGWYRSEDA